MMTNPDIQHGRRLWMSSALDLRLELPPQSQRAPVELLHLLHAIALAGQVLGHGVALAAV